jgi:ATP-dependent exoDNAse (exonuclease V) alpha subunit
MSNKGARWSPEQDAWLLNAIQKTTKTYCATALERSPYSIECRLCLLVQRLIEEGNSLEEALQKCKVTPHAYQKFCENKTKDKAVVYYAVAVGNTPGIYKDWKECKLQIEGYSGAVYKKCSTLEEAEAYLTTNKSTPPQSSPTPRVSPFIADFNLSAQQADAVEKVLQGKHVFLTGAAGCGKSRTIQAITTMLEAKRIPYGLTASTGAAAVLIGGKTLHSYLGIGLGDKPAEYYLDDLPPKKRSALKRLKVLIIDEISMISQELFEFISEYLQLLRNNEALFGGVQLVLCGDFFQLPPVKASFCFKSELWKALQLECIQLTHNFRQADDNQLQTILTHIRQGALTKEDMKLLEGCQARVFPNSIKPTCIYPINSVVERINQHAYERQLRKVQQETLFPGMDKKPLRLCVGLQVMVTRNIDPDKNIVNGTRGVIERMDYDTVHLRLLDGGLYAVKIVNYKVDDREVTYMPLALAYAITVHKSQGVTLDAAEIDLGNDIFEYGQAYTALSRVKNLESVRIVGVERGSFRNHPEVEAFYRAM